MIVRLLLRNSSNEQDQEAKIAKNLNVMEANNFQSGKKRIAIITEAGSNGISLH